MIFTGWDTMLSLLKMEVVQREYEGVSIPQDLRDRIGNLKTEEHDNDEACLNPLYEELSSLRPEPSFTYVQPNDLESIRDQRPEGPRRLDLNLSEEELLDRFHGAWTGRSVGCALGKPVEGMGMRGQKGMSGRKSIKTYLQNRDHWPLDQYFSGQDADDGLAIACPQSWRENIQYMEPDDDIHYTLVGLKVLEKRGPGFTWQNVANTWNSSLPFYAICTAECQAILNYSLRFPRMQGHKSAATPEFCRTHWNPYREWIGAQIRADGWAYACAGMPELAAEFAWRDAHWTHVANGIYGEMFYAAVIAASFVETDPKKLIQIGLSEIPRNCILAEALKEGLVWVQECKNFESFMDRLDKKYGGMSPVHTVNNALIVMMSMFYGRMDTGRTIPVSVMGGLDTDCNGATVGSIVGAVSGGRAFDAGFSEPLHDTIKPLVFGFQEVSMKELAGRTLKVHQKVLEYAEHRV